MLSDDGRRVGCQLRGALRKRGKHNAIVVGDRVEITLEDAVEGALRGCVESVEPRRNWISRKRAVGDGRELMLVANVDQVIAFFAVQKPRLKFGALDRLLVAAESRDLPATIVLNKIDLGVPEEVEERGAIYPDLGYRVLRASVTSGEGIDELREVLRGKVSVVVGPSGVGKSSLLNAICPELDLRVGAVSHHNEKGRHTTTAVSWFPVPEIEGAIVDTPGFRDYGLWGLTPRELVAAMPDLSELAGGCHFSDCRHVSEPGCEVRAAVERDEVSANRYDSYRYMLETL